HDDGCRGLVQQFLEVRPVNTRLGVMLFPYRMQGGDLWVAHRFLRWQCTEDPATGLNALEKVVQHVPDLRLYPSEPRRIYKHRAVLAPVSPAQADCPSQNENASRLDQTIRDSVHDGGNRVVQWQRVRMIRDGLDNPIVVAQKNPSRAKVVGRRIEA